MGDADPGPGYAPPPMSVDAQQPVESPPNRLAFALWGILAEHLRVEVANDLSLRVARAVVNEGWKPPTDEDVNPTVPLALAIGRMRDAYRQTYREWANGDKSTPSPTVPLSVLYARLTEALTMVVGPSLLVDHDERVRARVLDEEPLPRLARLAYLDPGAIVRRDFDYRGEGYPEPLDAWQDRAMREALRRYRLREGEPLV